jgi:hypothetical protein
MLQAKHRGMAPIRCEKLVCIAALNHQGCHIDLGDQQSFYLKFQGEVAIVP